jgi:hypothetical protein
MLRTRREILSMLQSSATETGIKLISMGPKHSHRITITSTRHGQVSTFRAVLLLRSSEWYTYRLNIFGKLDGIDSIVCAVHDSCVDVPVWSVEDAQSYAPGETVVPLSSLKDPTIRGTKYGCLLLVAAILCSKPEALAILDDAHFPVSTRYRYEAKVREYANLKRGVKLSVI